MPPKLLFFSLFMDERFPSDIYKYLKQHVPPSMLLKFMQICKYFQYQKFPYFVFPHGLNLMLNKNNPAYYFNRYKYGEYCDDFVWLQQRDFSNLPNSLWINKSLVCECNPNVVQGIIPKAAYFDIKWLILKNQNITIDEFKILTAAGKVVRIYLTKIFIENEDGKLIVLENLLKCLPIVEKIVIKDIIPLIGSLNAAKEACSPTLLCLKFKRIPETCFDVSTMLEFIHWHISKANPGDQNIVFDFTFNDDIPLDYIEVLQKSVDELVESWSYKAGHFHFDFRNCTEKSTKIMKEFCDQYAPSACDRWRCRYGNCKWQDYCECGLWRSPTPSEVECRNWLNKSYNSRSKVLDETEMSEQESADIYDEWEMERAEKAMKRNRMKKLLSKKKKSAFYKNKK